MEKKILALLLGGVMAVGSLFMQVPATAQAASVMDWVDENSELECDVFSGNHIESYVVNEVNGRVTVTIEADFDKESLKAQCYGGTIWAFEQELTPIGRTEDYYSADTTELAKIGKCMGGPIEQGVSTFTLTGLTGGTTYHLYALVVDPHTSDGELYGDYGVHYMMYIGEVTPTVSSGSAPSNSDDEETISYEDVIASQIEEAPSGSTIVMEKGISAISNSTMKELLAKGDVSLKLEFTYQDKEYVIIIPAGAALDNDIPWYGPLYLAQHFGNRAGTDASGTGDTYEVKSGDSLSRIAAANHMTLKQLLAKNPQITDPNKIAVGQKINR